MIKHEVIAEERKMFIDRWSEMLILANGCRRKADIDMLLQNDINNSAATFRLYADRYSAIISDKTFYEVEGPSIDVLNEYVGEPLRTILFVTHELSLTGAPMALFGLIKAVKKRGWQILLISREDGRLKELCNEEDIPVIVLPEAFKSDFISRASHLFRAVIVNTIESSPVVRQLSGKDIPVIWWIHESKAVYGVENAKKMPRKLGKNVHVYCAGEYAKRVLKSRAPKYKSQILLYGANDFSLEAGSGMIRTENAIQKKQYLCVGTIGRRKGQDILLDAIERLPENIVISSHFAFAGKSEDYTIKERIIAKSMENPELISYHGELTPAELGEIYRGSSFLICSSRDDPMPVVIAEAMSMGIPCICSSNTGSAKIVKKSGSGMIYYNNDPNSLAKMITAASSSSEEQYSKMSFSSRKAYDAYFCERVFEENVDRVLGKWL